MCKIILKIFQKIPSLFFNVAVILVGNDNIVYVYVQQTMYCQCQDVVVCEQTVVKLLRTWITCYYHHPLTVKHC